ncbi:hypothetical protein [Anderseniella sp. Alg231-50]|uniref:hypothetical protein n=1 Tax=Anderseniella sp. Alg231-50 TaxID=1922226 RepID=UPI000D552A44
MGSNRHDQNSVNDFRKTLADLIRMNDEHRGQYPDGNPATRPHHPHHHQQTHARHAGKTKPGMPRHLTETPHPVAPPEQHRHAASRTHLPTRHLQSRDEMFENRMSSVMAKHSRQKDVNSGMKVQAGLFAVGLFAACSATFALVYYLTADDRVTQASSHFQAPTAQAVSGTGSSGVSGNITGSNHVAAALSQPQAAPEASANVANAKALSDIANGNWLVLPSDEQQQSRSEEAASAGQQTVSQEPVDSTVLTRQELFESFQTYLEKTGQAPVTNSPHQEALFNSFVRWNIEVAKAN